MARTTVKPHLCLVCWHAETAEKRAFALKSAGYRVTCVTEHVQGRIGFFRDLLPDAIVVDLDRMPSHGRQLALALHASRSTRAIPLVFLGGEPAKVERVRSELPHASFAEWAETQQAIDKAMAYSAEISAPAVKKPERPQETDLARKLGVKPDIPVVLWGDTDFLLDVLRDSPEITNRPPSERPCLFLAATRTAAEVEAAFDSVSVRSAVGSSVWIVHPKQSSRLATDFNQNDVRAIGLAHGWVDYKVCSVDRDWSGLKFTRRKPGMPLQPRSMKHAAGGRGNSVTAQRSARKK